MNHLVTYSKANNLDCAYNSIDRMVVLVPLPDPDLFVFNGASIIVPLETQRHSP